MIDPKKVEDAADAAHPLPPPIEIVCAHRIPPIKRDAPVLSPLLSELVIFKIRLGRRSAAPIEHEFVRPREDIGAVITHSKRNVAHQRDSALLSKRIDLAPLFVRDPLHVTEKILARRKS